MVSTCTNNNYLPPPPPKSRITDRPIAIAYTPTEPTRIYRPADGAGPAYSHHGYQHPAEHGYFSHANHASSVIAEIREDADTASATTPLVQQYDNAATSAAAAAAAAAHHRRVHNDTDEFGNPSRGDNYRQEFEAPFYPSVNLDKHPETIRNNWAVVTPPSHQPESSEASVSADTSQSAKQTTSTTKAAGIDRSDSNVEAQSTTTSDSAGSASEQQSVKSANAAATVDSKAKEHFSQFQPELQGGFRPIYPPGMKSSMLDDDADDSVEQRKIVMVHTKSNSSQQSDEHGTEDESIAALVYDGLGASIAELIDGATADIEGDSDSKSR